MLLSRRGTLYWGFKKVSTWLRAIPYRLCFTALPDTSLRDGNFFFFWSTEVKVESLAGYVMRVPSSTARGFSAMRPFPKEASGSCANLFRECWSPSPAKFSKSAGQTKSGEQRQVPDRPRGIPHATSQNDQICGNPQPVSELAHPYLIRT